jgi:hypothetical protein
MKILTGIAPVCDSQGDPLLDLDGTRIASLFDRLTDGGLEVPDKVIQDWLDKGASPVRMLLSGSPGSGKTTLALELAYRLALSGIPDTNPDRQDRHFFPVLYICVRPANRVGRPQPAEPAGWRGGALSDGDG